MTDVDDLEPESSPTVTNLGRLIARMALDEVLSEKFETDPAAVIAAAGLSKKERKALESGDWAAIRKLLSPSSKPLGSDDPGSG